jgi:hypothetical protein
MRFVVPLVLLAAAVAPSLAHAGAAERRVAADVYRELMPPAMYPPYVEFVLKVMMDSAAQEGRPFPANRLDDLRKATAQALPYEDIVDAAASTIEARFSAAELKELLPFLRSPTGKKLIALQELLQREAGPKLQQLAVARLTVILQREGLLPPLEPKAAAPKK